MKAEPFVAKSVTVSSKYQIVLPREVREYLGVEPGRKLRLLLYDGQVRLVPVPTLEEARGSLRGMDTNVEREEEEQEC